MPQLVLLNSDLLPNLILCYEKALLVKTDDPAPVCLRLEQPFEKQEWRDKPLFWPDAVLRLPSAPISKFKSFKCK